MIKVVCVSAGYVESHMVGRVCFHAYKPFEDAEAALDSLAQDLLRVYQCDGADLPSKKTLEYFISDLLRGIADDWPDEMEDWWPWTEMKVLLDISKDQWYFLHDCWAEQKLAERALKQI